MSAREPFVWEWLIFARRTGEDIRHAFAPDEPWPVCGMKLRKFAIDRRTYVPLLYCEHCTKAARRAGIEVPRG